MMKAKVRGALIQTSRKSSPIRAEEGLTDKRVREILRSHGAKWSPKEVAAARAVVREGLDELASAAAMWATGIDANRKWCWCSEADEEHRASANNAVHAAACVWLRELVHDIAPKGWPAPAKRRPNLEQACRITGTAVKREKSPS